MDPGGAVGMNIDEAKGLETTEPRSVKKQIPINRHPGGSDRGAAGHYDGNAAFMRQQARVIKCPAG
jgi:hypothetical protein